MFLYFLVSNLWVWTCRVQWVRLLASVVLSRGSIQTQINKP